MSAPPIDPPLLPGEVEIDVSDLGSDSRVDRDRADLGAPDVSYVDLMVTSRGDVRSVESQISIERMIAAAKVRRRREQG